MVYYNVLQYFYNLAQHLITTRTQTKPSTNLAIEFHASPNMTNTFYRVWVAQKSFLSIVQGPSLGVV